MTTQDTRDTQDIAVVIPSWNSERAADLIWELVRRELYQRAEYIVVGCPRPEDLHDNLKMLSTWIVPEEPLSPVEAMSVAGERLLAQTRKPYVDDDRPGFSPSDIFVFLHDDVLITGQVGWDRAIIDHFAAHPNCGLAGFGGGIGFAADDIYKVSYDYRQLARLDFVSNMREAEQHGRRVTESCRVAALDGFSLITTREFYIAASNRFTGKQCCDQDHVNGAWAACLLDGIPFHMYDAWISCRAAELGYETWMLPIECHHAGGQTSVQMADTYNRVVARLGYASAEDLYYKAHERIYERFSRVLPIRVSYRQPISKREQL